MTNDERIVSETQGWLIYAKIDLQAAKDLMGKMNIFVTIVCYHSQQAAEKAVKAGLVFLQTEFPFTHDLDKLKVLLPENWQCRQNHPNLEKLSEWAVESRYPDSMNKPSYGEAEAAFQTASEVLAAIEADLSRLGVPIPEWPPQNKEKVPPQENADDSK